MVVDIIKDIGPLGGIYTGLTHIRGENGFFVACDMPFLNASLIRHMTTICEGFDVTVPKLSGKLHTLHAIYHKDCLPHIEDLIEKRDHKVAHFFGKVKVQYLTQKEIERFDPDLLSFFNVNTREDFEKLKTRWAQMNR